MALFDAAGDDAEHHALSLLLCSPGSVGRQQLEDLATGRRPLAQLPAVLRVAARLRCVLIVERYVEGCMIGRAALPRSPLTTAPCT